MRLILRFATQVLVLALVVGCGSSNGLNDAAIDARADAVGNDALDVARLDVPTTDVPANDVPATDTPATDATDVARTDVPATDVPGLDVPATDVPSADVPTTDVIRVDTPPVDVPGPDAGGCRSAAECPRGGVCSLTTCGSVGTCQPPLPCPLIIDPVCGCDGVTYSNDCVRRNASVGLDHRGACTTGPDAGGCAVAPGCCATDADCRGGGYCVSEMPPLCASGRAVGVCKTPPTALGRCWRDLDCRSSTMRCVGARICPCGSACLLPDEEGRCM